MGGYGLFVSKKAKLFHYAYAGYFYDRRQRHLFLNCTGMFAFAGSGSLAFGPSTYGANFHLLFSKNEEERMKDRSKVMRPFPIKSPAH